MKDHEISDCHPCSSLHLKLSAGNTLGFPYISNCAHAQHQQVVSFLGSYIEQLTETYEEFYNFRQPPKARGFPVGCPFLRTVFVEEGCADRRPCASRPAQSMAPSCMAFSLVWPPLGLRTSPTHTHQKKKKTTLAVRPPNPKKDAGCSSSSGIGSLPNNRQGARGSLPEAGHQGPGSFHRFRAKRCGTWHRRLTSRAYLACCGCHEATAPSLDSTQNESQKRAWPSTVLIVPETTPAVFSPLGTNPRTGKMNEQIAR